MASDQNTANQSIQQALEALEFGDKHKARYFAQDAIRLAPELEEPWLVLAAVSRPRASIAYLGKALEINPNSERARKGMEWALERQAKAETEPIRRLARAFTGQAEALSYYIQPYPGMSDAAVPITLPRGGKRKASRRPKQARYKRRVGLWLITPWLIGLVLFKLVPILASLGMSFTNMDLLDPFQYKFVGLKNYINLFTDPRLGASFLGTFKSALILIPLQIMAAVVLASLLNNPKLHFKNTVRMLFFLPSIIASYPAFLIWQSLTNPGTGWFYVLILNPLGLAKSFDLLGMQTIPLVRLLAALWSIGPGFLIMLGAMQGIPMEIYEAAMVDGANRLRRFFSITIPMISQAIFFTLILNLTTLFGGTIMVDIGFTFKTDTSSVDAFLYDLMFYSFRLGQAASLAWIFFIFMLVVVLVLFYTSKYWVYFPDQEN